MSAAMKWCFMLLHVSNGSPCEQESAHLYDSAGHCSDVGAPVAPDLRFIPDATQGDALKGALQHPGYGIGQTAHIAKL